MKRKVTVFSTVVIAIALITCVSNAQVVPFHAGGSNAVYDPNTAMTIASGNATYMGKIKASGFAVPTPTEDPLVLEWTAVGFQLTAANGDQLFFDGSGVVNLIPQGGDLFTAVWTADFFVVGGTGKFANASSTSEPLQVIAVNDPFLLPPAPGDIWTYAWSMNGKIDLGHRR